MRRTPPAVTPAVTLALTLAIALAVSLSATASAGQSLSITLSPAVVPLAGSGGQSVTEVLTLLNHSHLPLDFSLGAFDVVVRDGARVWIAPGELGDSIAATAVFTPRELRVEPGSSAAVTVTFTLPLEVRHRAAVALFRGTTPVPSEDRRALLSIGTLFTFTVDGRVSVAAGPLETAPPSATSLARLQTRLHNDGEEPVTVSGMAVILDAVGNLVGKAPFADRRLLPGEVAIVAADYPGELRPDAYRAVATLEVAGQPMTLTGSLVVP